MGGTWPYSCCFAKFYFQEFFDIFCSIRVLFPSSFFSERLVCVHIVHPYSKIDAAAAWNKFRLILSNRSIISMINNRWIAVHTFVSPILMSFSVNGMLLPMYVNLSTDFREPPFSVSISSFLLKHMYYFFSAQTWKPMPLIAFSRRSSGDFAWVSVFERSAMSSVSVIVSSGYRLLLAFCF